MRHERMWALLVGAGCLAGCQSESAEAPPGDAAVASARADVPERAPAAPAMEGPTDMAGTETPAPAVAETPETPEPAVPGEPRLLFERDPAPDFSAQVLDGAPLKLSDYRGHVVVLSFWGID